APGIPHHENRPRPPRESRGRKSRHLIWNRVGAGSSDEQIESAVAVPVGKAQFPASGVPGESSAHRNQGSVREPELPAAFKIEVIDLPVEVKMIVAVGDYDRIASLQASDRRLHPPFTVKIHPVHE